MLWSWNSTVWSQTNMVRSFDAATRLRMLFGKVWAILMSTPGKHEKTDLPFPSSRMPKPCPPPKLRHTTEKSSGGILALPLGHSLQDKTLGSSRLHALPLLLDRLRLPAQDGFSQGCDLTAPAAWPHDQIGIFNVSGF